MKQTTPIEVTRSIGIRLMNYKKRLGLKRMEDIIDILLKLVSFEEIKTYLEGKVKKRK